MVKAKLLIAIMDLPAKAALLNCTQYNGVHGCSSCVNPGRTVSITIQFKIGECSNEHYIIIIIHVACTYCAYF